MWTLRHVKQDIELSRVASLTPAPVPTPTRLQIFPSLTEGLGGRTLRVVVKEVCLLPSCMYACLLCFFVSQLTSAYGFMYACMAMSETLSLFCH